jgi:hypothetical protein
MEFARFYFEKYNSEERLIEEKPSAGLKTIVTIPCFNEDNTIKALEGLYCCSTTNFPVEVIVLVNYPDDEGLLYKTQHEELYKTLSSWASKHNTEKIKFYILLKKLPAKFAGVGLARKIAMDEALRRFNDNNNPGGIIVGFDADCTCDKNYLAEIESFFSKSQNANGCSIYFEHPVSGNEYPQFVYNAIVQYELYLRYYVEAFRFAGFPYAYHTLGSSFAVRADMYARQGGMNRRKAGEDFYFLNKIIPLENYFELNSTRVVPSPRESNRVPFGTGAAISKIVQSENQSYLTYNFETFELLGIFLNSIAKCFKQPVNKALEILEKQHPSLKEYLIKIDFVDRIEEINSNCNNIHSFNKRFYNWFNGLVILQLLNELHINNFNKTPINIAAKILLERKGLEVESIEPLKLLYTFREMQRNISFRI